MPDRYLLESGAPDGYLLEDSSGVLVNQNDRYPAEVLADSPVGYWRLGDAGPTMVATIGANLSPNDAAATFGVAGLLAGDSNTACSFVAASTQDAAGSDAGLQTGNGAWSLECWVKTTATTFAVILGFGRQGTANADAFMTMSAAGALQFDNTTASHTFGGTINDGKRHHCVLTWSGTLMTAYVDGATVGSTYAYGTFALQVGVTGVELAFRSGNWWTGTLDEAAIYSTALSSTRALAHYTAGSTLSATPTVTALVVNGVAPTVTASDNQTATPSAATLVATGVAPTVTATANQTATPSVAALVATGIAPSTVLGTIVTPSVAALVVSGVAPTVTATDLKTATPSVAALAVTGIAPSTVLGTVSSPSALALTASGVAPTVTASDNKSASPSLATLALTGVAPTVTAGDQQTATPSVAALVLAGVAPDVTASDNQTASPSVAAVALTGIAPTTEVSGPVEVSPDPASLTLTGIAAEVTGTPDWLPLPAGGSIRPYTDNRRVEQPPEPAPVLVAPTPARFVLLTERPDVAVNDDALVLLLVA